MMLTRCLIRKVISTQFKEIADNCNRASLIISPSENNMWDISVCLKPVEVDKIRQLGYWIEKQPG